MFLFGFNGFTWLFEPMRIHLDQVSAQTVASGKLGYWGGGPLAESLRCQKSRGTVKQIVFWRMSVFRSPNTTMPLF